MNRFLPALALFALLLQGCATSNVERVDNPVVAQQTIEGVGACQGVFFHDGSIWMYGDRDGTGVIKRLEWIGPDEEGGPAVRDTRESYDLIHYRRNFIGPDRSIELPRNPIPHPTGLTQHPELGTYIGNTVDQQGTIFRLVWWGFLQSGSLDTWIQNAVTDDLATNGTRPEFVRYNGQWVVATADYGDQGNQLRLYDPELLKTVQRTSEEGVLIAAFDCGPFVQSMHWIDEDSTLVLAQNQTAGLGYRLTLMKFGEGAEAPVVERIIDFGEPTDELEGFAVVAPGWAIMTSAMRENNLTIIRWPVASE